MYARLGRGMVPGGARVRDALGLAHGSAGCRNFCCLFLSSVDTYIQPRQVLITGRHIVPTNIAYLKIEGAPTGGHNCQPRSGHQWACNTCMPWKPHIFTLVETLISIQSGKVLETKPAHLACTEGTPTAKSCEHITLASLFACLHNFLRGSRVPTVLIHI